MKLLLAQPIIESIIPKISPGLHLAIILVGDDFGSQIYIQKKSEAFQKIQGKVSVYHYPQSVKQETLTALIDSLNLDPQVNGIILQLPLAEHLNEQRLLNQISYTKDADGLSEYWLGRLLQTRIEQDIPAIIPATPRGILDLLAYYQISLKEKIVLILNDSLLVGKPLATILTNYGATPIIAHQYTPQLKTLLRLADIVISATGNPDILTIDDFYSQQIILDVGISRQKNGGIRGDIYTKGIQFQGPITPVPGGIGPLTVWALVQNVQTLKNMFQSF